MTSPLMSEPPRREGSKKEIQMLFMTTTSSVEAILEERIRTSKQGTRS